MSRDILLSAKNIGVIFLVESKIMKGERMKKIIKMANNIILIILIIVLLFVCYSKYIRKKPVVKLGGYAILVVLTDSMEPEIQGNELILIQEKNEYELGDIVTYQDNDNILITHRIVEIQGDSFIAKGDSNAGKDDAVQIERIQGKVLFHSKVLGIFILYYLKFVIFSYVIVVLVIYFIKNILNRSKNEKKEN